MHLIWDIGYWMSSIRASRMRRSRTVVAQNPCLRSLTRTSLFTHTRRHVALFRSFASVCDVAPPPSPEIWKRSTDRCTAKSTAFFFSLGVPVTGAALWRIAKASIGTQSHKKLYVYYSCKKSSTSSCTFEYKIKLENQQNHFHYRLSDRQLYTMKTNSFSVRRPVLRHPVQLRSSADSPVCHFPITVDAFGRFDHCLS